MVLLVGIEMVNTQTLKSQLKQIDHDMQKYFGQYYRKWSTNIHQILIRLSVPQTLTLLVFYEQALQNYLFHGYVITFFFCMATKLFNT